MKRFILILFLLLAAREIRAFGLAGHAAIACIAEHHLTPRARTNIMRYTDHRSIVYYASWMDEWRRSKGYEFTTHWHAGTVDAEFRSTPAVREASGAKGDCVVAVEQSIANMTGSTTRRYWCISNIWCICSATCTVRRMSIIIPTT